MESSGFCPWKAPPLGLRHATNWKPVPQAEAPEKAKDVCYIKTGGAFQSTVCTVHQEVEACQEPLLCLSPAHGTRGSKPCWFDCQAIKGLSLVETTETKALDIKPGHQTHERALLLGCGRGRAQRWSLSSRFLEISWSSQLFDQLEPAPQAVALKVSQLTAFTEMLGSSVCCLLLCSGSGSHVRTLSPLYFRTLKLELQ